MKVSESLLIIQNVSFSGCKTRTNKQQCSANNNLLRSHAKEFCTFEFIMKYGILSDIHEDIVSLKKAILHLEQKGCDELICLGDIAGYSTPFFDYKNTRSANLCWEVVKENCQHIIPGNHDLYAAKCIPKENLGFTYPSNWYNRPFQEREKLGAGKIWLYEPNELESNIDSELKSIIKSLPDVKTIQTEDKLLLISHYLYPDLSGSECILPPTKNLFQSHLEYSKQKGASLSFIGHCHPEGLLLYQKDEINYVRFYRSVYCSDEIIVGVPCIANGRNHHGYAIFDSNTMNIKAYPLNPFFKRICR